MKGGKKPKGTKARVQAYKKRLVYIGTAIIVTILVAIIAVSGLLIACMHQTNDQPSQPKAAIVDHLSLSRPNQTFVETVTNILITAGYAVDYYPGEEVTVEFYRNLPTQGHSLVILRVHSALVSAEDPPVTLFTSEPYSRTKYVYEQLKDRVGWVTYRFENGTPTEPTYFGISPLFVEQSMNGRFQDTIIVMMGCNGLTYVDMAQAFVQKGAKAYISWSEDILGTRNDPAIEFLLRQLVLEKQTMERAVADTMKEFAPSPADNSLLMYYPLEAGAYTVES